MEGEEDWRGAFSGVLKRPQKRCATAKEGIKFLGKLVDDSEGWLWAAVRV